MIPKVDFNATKEVDNTQEVDVKKIVIDVNGRKLPKHSFTSDYDLGEYVTDLLEGNEDE